MERISRAPSRAANRIGARALALAGATCIVLGLAAPLATAGQFTPLTGAERDIATSAAQSAHDLLLQTSNMRTVEFDFARPYAMWNDLLPSPEQMTVRPTAKPEITVETQASAEPHSKRLLLGSLGKATSFTPVSTRWNRIQNDTAPVAGRFATCDGISGVCSELAMRGWDYIVSKARTMRKGYQLSYINRTINRLITYRDDRYVWKTAEYWASPQETLAKKAGDCEDFAILKYCSLREVGFKDANMRIVVLKDRAASRYHAVLAAYYNDDWLILDNRFSRVRLQRDLLQYQQLYSLNDQAQWSHATKPAQPVRLAARLKERFAE